MTFCQEEICSGRVLRSCIESNGGTVVADWWSGLVQCCLAWYGVVWLGMVLHDVVWCCMLLCAVVWCGKLRYCFVQCGMVWRDQRAFTSSMLEHREKINTRICLTFILSLRNVDRKVSLKSCVLSLFAWFQTILFKQVVDCSGGGSVGGGGGGVVGGGGGVGVDGSVN